MKNFWKVMMLRFLTVGALGAPVEKADQMLNDHSQNIFAIQAAQPEVKAQLLGERAKEAQKIRESEQKIIALRLAQTDSTQDLLRIQAEIEQLSGKVDPWFVAAKSTIASLSQSFSNDAKQRVQLVKNLEIDTNNDKAEQKELDALRTAMQDKRQQLLASIAKKDATRKQITAKESEYGSFGKFSS